MIQLLARVFVARHFTANFPDLRFLSFEHCSEAVGAAAPRDLGERAQPRLPPHREDERVQERRDAPPGPGLARLLR